MSSLCWTCVKRIGISSCSGCKIAKYCSKACQSQGWKLSHKKECSFINECYLLPFQMTLRSAEGMDVIYVSKAREFIEILIDPENDDYLRKNNILGEITGSQILQNALHTFGYDWIVTLMKLDMQIIPLPVDPSKVNDGPIRVTFVFPERPPLLSFEPSESYSNPNGYHAFNLMLGRSNNQTWPFHVKNFYLTEDAFNTMIKYLHYLLIDTKNKELGRLLLRYINSLHCDPLVCNVAMRCLLEDQVNNKSEISNIIKNLTSDVIPNSLQGLVFQFIALMDIQCNDLTVNKEIIIKNIIIPRNYNMLYQLAVRFAREELVRRKTLI